MIVPYHEWNVTNGKCSVCFTTKEKCCCLNVTEFIGRTTFEPATERGVAPWAGPRPGERPWARGLGPGHSWRFVAAKGGCRRPIAANAPGSREKLPRGGPGAGWGVSGLARLQTWNRS